MPVKEKTFRLAKYFCSVHMEKLYLAYQVKTRQKVILLSGKVVFIWGKHYPGHRDLACQQARSRYMEKVVVSYERNVNFDLIFIPR
jgi:hypothetical protein